MLKEEYVRDLPGWEKIASVPLCMGGDFRALTFCCKPGYSLTYAFKCKRDETLKELGISPEEFMEIKERFSKEIDWDSEFVCFGSLSYCCMRRGGCPNRDYALSLRYPGKSKEETMKIYFQKKKELAKIICECIQDPEERKKVKSYLDLF